MTGNPVIVPIVEGNGEVDAVPILLRRVLGERHSRYDIRIQKPINTRGKTTLLKKFGSFLEYARQDQECDAVLVLLDGDEDCPRDLATDLAQSAAEINMSIPVAVVCAHREYEAWFVASLDSETGNEIRSRLGISQTTGHRAASSLSLLRKDGFSAICLRAGDIGNHSISPLLPNTSTLNTLSDAPVPFAASVTLLRNFFAPSIRGLLSSHRR